MENREQYLPEKIILRLKEVVVITGLSKSTIYAKLKQGTSQYDSKFPKRIKLGARAVGWLKEDILEWLTQCNTSLFKEGIEDASK